MSLKFVLICYSLYKICQNTGFLSHIDSRITARENPYYVHILCSYWFNNNQIEKSGQTTNLWGTMSREQEMTKG